MLFRPATWAAVALTIRLAALLLLPLLQSAVAVGANRGIGPRGQADSVVAFLDRRTDFRVITEDEGAYDEMARHIVAGDGFILDHNWLITGTNTPAMYAGCSYPLFLAAIYGLTRGSHQLPVWLLQVFLGALAALLLCRTAQRVAGPWAVAATGAFYAFHPALTWLTLSMMSEAICVPLLAFVVERLVCASPRTPASAALVGVASGVLCLARSTYAYPLALVAIVFALRRRTRKPLAAAAAAFCLVCAPWTVRNGLNFGRFIPFSTKSGVNAWMHNHPGLAVEFGPRAIFAPNPVDIFSPEIQTLPDEATRDARLMELFKQHLRNDPLHVVGLCVVRFWMALLPVTVTDASLQAKLTALYAKAPPLVLLLVSPWLVRRRLWWRAWPVVAVLVSWQALQTLAGPGLRYRLGAEPAWVVLVGVLAAVLLARASRHRHALSGRWLRSRPRTTG